MYEEGGETWEVMINSWLQISNVPYVPRARKIGLDFRRRKTWPKSGNQCCAWTPLVYHNLTRSESVWQIKLVFSYRSQKRWSLKLNCKTSEIPNHFSLMCKTVFKRKFITEPDVIYKQATLTRLLLLIIQSVSVLLILASRSLFCF